MSGVQPLSSQPALSGWADACMPRDGQPAQSPPTQPHQADAVVIGEARGSVAPKFALGSPRPWIEYQSVRVSAPLHIESKVLVGGIVAGAAAAKLVKLGSVVAEAVRISRTTGLKTFASQVGVKGVLRHTGKTLGKGMLRAAVVQVGVIAVSAAVGAVVFRMNEQDAAGSKAPAK